MKKKNSIVELAKILVFALIIMVSFAGYAKFGIPLVIPAPPPVEEKITGAVSIEQMIAMGDKIFHGKGTCTLCHSPVGGRAPLLEQIGTNGPARLKDPRYKGKAKTVYQYILESEKDPSAYVVAGFGKPGTNDTVSPMPQTNKGAIGLSDFELDCVASYLLKTGGLPVTEIKPPTGAAAAGATAAGAAPEEVKPAATAEEAFNKFGCPTCHKVPGLPEGGDVGPDLTQVVKLAKTRKPGMSAEAYIFESITNPNAYIVKGFEKDIMPQDFAQKMTISEIQLITKHLLAKK
jgi:hypothetical protein